MTATITDPLTEARIQEYLEGLKNQYTYQSEFTEKLEYIIENGGFSTEAEAYFVNSLDEASNVDGLYQTDISGNALPIPALYAAGYAGVEKYVKLSSKAAYALGETVVEKSIALGLAQQDASLSASTRAVLLDNMANYNQVGATRIAQAENLVKGLKGIGVFGIVTSTAIAAKQIWDAASNGDLDTARELAIKASVIEGVGIAAGVAATALLSGVLSGPAVVGATIISVGVAVGYMEENWNDIRDTIVDGFNSGIETLQDVIDDLESTYSSGIVSLWDDTTANVSDFIDDGQQYLDDLIDDISVPNPVEAVSDFIDGVLDNFENTETFASPLVLDLDGDGVELISLTNSEAYWDIDEDGMAEHSGWVSADDALLAIDWNADGIINDNSELFGSATTDGFTFLSALDTNTDGVINNLDTDFSNLLLWQDLNQDGVSQVGELTALSTTVLSIDLSGVTEVSYDLQGNPISHESTFSFVGGGTGDIVDAWFAHDNVNTRYDQAYELDLQTLFLPNLRGYGNLPDLHIAMSLDSDLKDLVADLADKSFADYFVDDGSIYDDVVDILYKWADVEGISPTSRGQYLDDARNLEFQEELLGQEFVQRDTYSNPHGMAANSLDESFNDIVHNFMSKIIVQSAASELFTGALAYDFQTDEVTGVTGLSATALSSLETIAASATNSLGVWKQVVAVVENIIGTANLTTTDYDALEDAIQTTDPSVTLFGVVGSLDIHENGEYFGDEGANTLIGSYTNDLIKGELGDDTLYGNGGDDELVGAQGNDTLVGGTGNDLLDGNNGDDTFVYNIGDGDDTITDSSGSDVISFGSGITISDITIERVSYTDIKITIDGSGVIYIEDQLSASISSNRFIETLEFSDTSTFDLLSVSYETHGTSGDDTLSGIRAGSSNEDDIIYGYAGNDKLYGSWGDDEIYGGDGDDYIRGDYDNDYLEGGAGNDTLDGGSGDDVYFYSSGHDIIENEDSGTDVLEFVSGYSYGDLIFSRDIDDLIISIDASNSITIKDHFSGDAVETLRFSDASEFSTSGITLAIYGTEGNDNIYGTTSGGSPDDVIFGLGGNDYISAYSGNNRVFGGDGNDTISAGSDDDELYGDAGDDTITAGAGNDYIDGGAGDDVMKGGSGDDHYFYSSGHDTINGESNGSDVLELDTPYVLGDITFIRYNVTSSSADDNFVIEFDASNSITIEDQFYSNTRVIETILFSDLSTLNLTTQQFETHGTSGNDTINGISYGGSQDDIIYGFDGNDTISAGSGNDYIDGGAGDDVMMGSSGDDHYFYSSGHDTIKSEANGSEILELSSSYVLGDLTFIRYDVGTNDDDLSILIDGSNSITIERQFYNTSGIVETLRFSDLSEVNLATQQYETHGTSGNDSLAGISTGGSQDDIMYGFDGDDYINAGTGNDYIEGGAGNDTMIGYSGDDHYFYSSGHDIIKEHNGNDVLELDSAFDQYDLTFIRYDVGTNDDDLSILIDGSNSIVIEDQFYNSSKFVETLLFSDDSEIDLTALQIETHGTSGNDSLVGIYYGASQNDIMYGFEGNDSISGSNGDDRLIGGEGVDTLIGGSGADTFVFDDTTFASSDVVNDFDLGEDDVLDLSALLSEYDPLSDLISDFVSTTEVSGDTVFAVDQDGAGTTYGFENVVTLNSVTGLVLDDLIDDGNVIV